MDEEKDKIGKIIQIPKLDSGIKLEISLLGEDHQRFCFQDMIIYNNNPSQDMDLFKLVVDYKEGLIDSVEYFIQLNFLKMKFRDLFFKKPGEEYVFNGEFGYNLEGELLMMNKASIGDNIFEVSSLKSELEKLKDFTSCLTLETTIRMDNHGFYEIPFISPGGNLKSFVFPSRYI